MAKQPALNRTPAEDQANQPEGKLEAFAGAPDQPRDDNYVKDTNSPVPNEQISHDPSKAPRETNLDPLGVGGQFPTNAVADPVDTRAIGKVSAVGIEVKNYAEGEERPGQTPSFAGQVVTTAGITDPADAASLGAGGVAPMRGTDVKYLEGARVELLKPHYINDVYYEAGTIVGAYTGPTSKDIREVDEQNRPIKR